MSENRRQEQTSGLGFSKDRQQEIGRKGGLSKGRDAGDAEEDFDFPVGRDPAIAKGSELDQELSGEEPRGRNFFSEDKTGHLGQNFKKDNQGGRDQSRRDR
jgi:hypothetical protein